MASAQDRIDERNARFWDDLCGSALARSIGIEDAGPESLRRFDEAYMAMYPYLEGYLPARGTRGRVLEIGLGYGTLSQALAERARDYHGLDIAEGPVQMVRDRLDRLGYDDSPDRVQIGSALEIPHPDGEFDHFYSIGCLHHTGDLPRAISEAHRVLRPGGRAVVMLYNAHSLRRLVKRPRLRLRAWRERDTDAEEALRAAYDTNAEGEAAPFTDYVSPAKVRELFADFRTVHIERRNLDPITLGPLVVPRQRLLGNLDRLLGLDLYISAVR